MAPVFRISPRLKSLLIALCCSFTAIVSLAFMGRNRYHFDFLLHWTGWLLVGLYMLYFLFLQAITYFIILRKYNDEGKNLLTNIMAIPLGVALIFLFNILRQRF